MRKLPKRMTMPPTTVFNVGGTVIPISSLPDEIAEEFLLIDAIRNEASEYAYKLEVLQLALNAKTEEVGAKIVAYLTEQMKNSKKEENTDQENDNNKQN